MRTLERCLGLVLFLLVLWIVIWAPGRPVQAQATAHNITVTWTAGNAADTWNVYRSTSQTGPSSRVNSSPLTQPSYVDTAITPGSFYCYQATESNSAGESGPSNQSCATALGAVTPPPIPNPPTGLLAVPK